MRRVLAYLVRFAVVIIGYAAACLSASVFVNLVVLGSHDFGTEQAERIAAAWSLVTIPVLALVIANLAFIPAMVVAVVAELLTWRSWLTYALAGGAIGIAVTLIVRRADPAAASSLDNPGALPVIAAAGLVGGIVYWITAGRWAGGWSSGDRPISPGR